MIALLTLAAALGAGVIAGVFFTFSNFVMPALARLPAAQGVAAMQSINVTVLNRWFLGVFVGTALLGLVHAVRSATAWDEPGARLAFVAGVVYVVGTFAVTRAFNIPRNDALDAVVPDSTEAAVFWATYLKEWCFWNHVRGAASVISAALFILSLAESRRFVSHLVGAALCGGVCGE